jgi:hypothetical protein
MSEIEKHALATEGRAQGPRRRRRRRRNRSRKKHCHEK